MEPQPTHSPNFADVVALAGIAGVVWLLSLSVLTASSFLRFLSPDLDAQRHPALDTPATSWPVMPTAPAMDTAQSGAQRNRTAADANSAWIQAITHGDTAAAQALYLPATSVPPAKRVTPSDLLDTIKRWPEQLRTVRYHGDYTPPEMPGVRLALSELIFEQSQICLQTSLVDAGPAGWFVQSWEQLDPEACAVSLRHVVADE